MAITADELAAIRDWVPATWAPTALFDDAAVTATWDRLALDPDPDAEDPVQALVDASLASVYTVALALTRRYVAILSGDPDSFSVGGEYSESRGAGMNVLMNQMTKLESLANAAVGLVTGSSRVRSHQLCRPNFYGR